MEQIRGTLSELAKSGSGSTFIVRVKGGADTHVQTSATLPKELAEGDTVVVLGTSYPDPPFIAESVIREAPIVPPKFPWKWILGIAAVVLICVVAFLLLHHSGGGALGLGGGDLTVRAMDGTAPAANISLQVIDSAKTPVKSGKTNSDGESKFKGLKAGEYLAEDTAGESVAISLHSGEKLTAILPVHSPYMWTVRTTSCNRPAPSSPITLVNAGNAQIASVQTGANGSYTFANLPVGTYTAKGKFNRSVVAVINGSSAPPAGTLNQQSPFVICFLMPGRVNSMQQQRVQR